MDHSSPQISVITAVFNRVETVQQALDSVRAQTWSNVQHIVIDGASRDGTLEVLEQHRASLSVLLSEPDKGIYHALNKGLRLATGDVIGFMHSDDFYADDGVLETVARAFSDPTIDGVYGDLDYVDKHAPDRVIRAWRSGEFSRPRLARGWMPPHPTLFLRRAVIERWGGFDTRYRIAADYDAMLRYLGQGEIRLAYIPQVLYKMRTGGESNRSLLRILRKSSEDYSALKRNGVGGLRALAWKNLGKLPQFFVGSAAAGAHSSAFNP